MRGDSQRKPAHLLMRAPLPQGAALLWLATAVLVLLSLPLFALFASMRADVSRLQAAIIQAQARSASPATQEELAALRQAAASGLASDESVSTAVAAAVQGGVPWTAVLERILPSQGTGVSLAALEQRGSELRLRGSASSEAALTAYLARLSAASIFSSVQAERNVASQPVGPGPLAFTVTLRVRGYQP